MNKALRIIMLLVFIGSFFAINIAPTEAQTQTNDYTVLAPLPGTTLENDSTKANLQSYIPGLFKLIIGLAAVLAVGYIIYGGFLYITTDAVQNKQEGKKIITNAIYGLVMVSVAWLILYTINPRLLKFDLNIESSTVSSRFPTTGTLGAGRDAREQVIATCPLCSIQFTPINLSPEDVARLSCTTCAPLSSLLSFNGNTQRNAAPELNSRLVSLKQSTGNLAWNVSEAYPPVQHHDADCHFNGTCIDASLPASSRTSANINSFASNASSANLRAVYEVSSAAEKQALINQGVTAPIQVVSGVTPHFSVYMR